MRANGEELRLADVLAALSLATDLGNGMPLERTMRTALIAVAVGRRLGVARRDLSTAYHLALLRSIGCTAYASEEAEAYADDITYRRTYFPVDFAKPDEIVAATRDHLAAGEPDDVRQRAIERFFEHGPELVVAMATSACSVAVRFAERLGMDEVLARGLTQIWERWDGKGFPGGLAGEAIEVSARLVHLGNVVEIDHRVGGRELASANVAGRSGGWFDPDVAAAFLEDAPAILARIEGESAWEAVLDAEPEPHLRLPVGRLDEITSAFADFADLKSPYLAGHSSGVARLAASAGEALGLDAADVERLRHAGYLHDLGRVSVSSGIWDRRGPLGAADWERVRLHAYYGERVTSQSPVLRPLSELVGMHHERLDGSGYHRNAAAPSLSRPTRVLAAADVFQALIEERPHRPAHERRQATAILQDEAKAGRLDQAAVGAVLEAAGERARGRRMRYPAGLSEREVQVLRLLARGRSEREVAEELVISPSTAHTHVAHIYQKAGVSTRAALALFAMEQDLLEA